MRLTKLVFALLFIGKMYSGASAQTLLEQAADTISGTEKVTATFKSTRLINGHSMETIYKHDLEFRVDHRFGDIAGSNGGVENFYGLDQSTDIKIGFEYGVSDRFTIGIARAKGATAATQLYEASAKYRLFMQTVDNRMPVSLTLFGSTTATGVKASDDVTAATSYSGFSDRLAYVSQLIFARKFSNSFSFAVTPTYLHRNYTAYGDENALFAVGVGGRLKISKRMALVADYFLPFRNQQKKEYRENASLQQFYNPLGVGLEIETGGHVFHLNFTNATAIQEQQFIAETTTSWLKGQYRWGFSISRRFSLE